jgi:hypothetical protein
MLCVLAGVLITLTGLVETGVVHGAQVADGQHHQAVITTGVIAGVFSIHALWCLLLLGMGRRRWLGGWPGAVASYSAALLALFAAIIAVVANVGFG